MLEIAQNVFKATRKNLSLKGAMSQGHNLQFYCAKVVTLIVPLLDYEQSPFILGPSSKTRETCK